MGIPAERVIVMGDSGGDGPHFEWASQTGAFTIGSMTAAFAGNYFVRITNAVGVVTSRTAVVTYEPDAGAPGLLYAVAGTNGTPAFSISSLDSDFDPMAWIALAGGPMNTMPVLAQASAKRAFSDRNP